MKSNAIIICFSIFFYVSTSSQTYIDFSTVSLTNSYTSISFFDSDSVQWHAIKARSGSTTTNNNAALCLNKSADACLYSDSIPYGISHLSFQYQQAFSTNCNAQVYINDSCIGNIKTSQEQGITYTFSSDISWCTTPAVIKIVQVSSTSGQITLDDITYAPAWEPIKPFQLISHSYTNDTIRLYFSRNISEVSIFCNTRAYPFLYDTDSSLIYIPNFTECGFIYCCLQLVNDTFGTQMGDTCITFYKARNASQHDVVITEIYMHTKTGSGPLPFEYIELYNRTACPIDLSSVKFVRDAHIFDLPTYILPPQTAIVLYNSNEIWTGDSSVLHLGISKFPTLSNSQAHIALIGTKGEIISSVSYNSSWYAHAFKENGGWSLEKIDITNTSEMADNWRASESYTGGTPGFINSVEAHHVDTIKPYITALYFISDTSIIVEISENIRLEQIAQCTLSQNMIDSVQSVAYSLQKFIVYLQKPCARGTEYIFENTEIVDFSGNKTEWNFEIALFDSLLQRNAIVIHEILSNPESGTSSFIELYNANNQYYNLADIYVCRIYNSEYSSITPLSETPRIWKPYTYLVISEDIAYWKMQSNCSESAEFIQIKALPSLPNSEGNCVILNAWGQVIDSVWYTETMHNPSLYSHQGVSFERISVTGNSNSRANWESVISENGNYSPGCAATQSVPVKIIAKSNIIHSQNQTIEFEFSAAQKIQSVTLTVYGMNGRSQAEFTQICNSTNTHVLWNGTNFHGNRLKPGVYVVSVNCELQNSLRTHKEFRCIIQE